MMEDPRETAQIEREKRLTSPPAYIQTYKRTDGLFEWRLKAANHEFICGSQPQGFSDRYAAEAAAYRAVELMTTPNLEVRSA